MKTRDLTIGTILVLSAIVIVVAVTYRNSNKSGKGLVFSKNETLFHLWNASKADQLEPGTYRTLDKSRDNITTSEGEGYTLLRSVWEDDKITFDRAWSWSKDNLQRPDSLFSWQFGKHSNGKYGVLSESGGQNTATDGDTDIALSLVMAYSRWQQKSYLESAKAIIRSIWEHEVVLTKGRPVLVANNLEKNNPLQVIVNPSYFEPYAFKIFAKVDPSHDWKGLVDNSYVILAKTQEAKLGSANNVGLLPNWIIVDRATGDIRQSDNSKLDTNYGYDAMRVPWRLALDYQWFNDPRDKSILANMSYLEQQWKNNGQLASIYGHDGKIVKNDQAPAIYGGDIGYFSVIDSTISTQIYDQKLASLYDLSTQNWRDPLNYYDDNWAWFGIGLYSHALPNLTEAKQ